MKILITFLFTAVLVGLFFLLFTRSSDILLIHQARKKGLYPSREEASLEDVKRLLLIGERFWAVNVYREIYGLSLKQAEKEVDLLERTLEETLMEEDE